MTTEKTIALTRWTFVGKGKSLHEFKDLHPKINPKYLLSLQALCRKVSWREGTDRRASLGLPLPQKPGHRGWTSQAAPRESGFSRWTIFKEPEAFLHSSEAFRDYSPHTPFSGGRKCRLTQCWPWLCCKPASPARGDRLCHQQELKCCPGAPRTKSLQPPCSRAPTNNEKSGGRRVCRTPPQNPTGWGWGGPICLSSCKG